MTTLILFFVVAVGFSFICSLSEAGLLSLRRTDVIKLKEAGSWGAGILEGLTSNVERALAGILTVNTLANCLGAAGVGSAASALWGPTGMATAGGVMTVTILVFSEIIPKTLGANYPVKLSKVIAVSVQTMLIVTYPVVLLMGLISKLIGGGQQKYSREDVLLAARLGVSDGVLETHEADVMAKMLDRVVSPVRGTFTPRARVTSFSRDRTVDDVCRDPGAIAHSRFPVFGDRPDVIVGIVRQDRILKKAQDGEHSCRLADIMDPPVTVREGDTLERAASVMNEQRSKMVLVTDEDDRYLGVLSTGNLLDHMFGSRLATLA